jgi:hypothetical protein
MGRRSIKGTMLVCHLVALLAALPARAEDSGNQQARPAHPKRETPRVNCFWPLTMSDDKLEK